MTQGYNFTPLICWWLHCAVKSVAQVSLVPEKLLGYLKVKYKHFILKPLSMYCDSDSGWKTMVHFNDLQMRLKGSNFGRCRYAGIQKSLVNTLVFCCLSLCRFIHDTVCNYQCLLGLSWYRWLFQFQYYTDIASMNIDQYQFWTDIQH